MLWFLRLFSSFWRRGNVFIFQNGSLIDQVSVEKIVSSLINRIGEPDRPLYIKFHKEPFTSPSGGKRTLEVTKWDVFLFRRYQIDLTITSEYIAQLDDSVRRLENDKHWT